MGADRDSKRHLSLEMPLRGGLWTGVRFSAPPPRSMCRALLRRSEGELGFFDYVESRGLHEGRPEEGRNTPRGSYRAFFAYYSIRCESKMAYRKSLAQFWESNRQKTSFLSESFGSIGPQRAALSQPYDVDLFLTCGYIGTKIKERYAASC